MEEKIFHRKLSKREKILFAIFLFTLLEFIFYKFLILPKDRDIYESNLSILKLENQIEDNKLKKQNIEKKPEANIKKEENKGSVQNFLNLKKSEVTNFINSEDDNSYTFSFKGSYDDIITAINTLGVKGRAYEFDLLEDGYSGNIFAKTDEKITIEENTNQIDSTKSLKDIFLKKDKNVESSVEKDDVKKSNNDKIDGKSDKKEDLIKNNGEFYIESSSENAAIKSIDDMIQVKYTNLEFKNNFDMQFIDLFFENLKLKDGESLKIIYYPINQWGTFGYIEDMKRYPIYAGYVQEKNNQIIIPDAKDINGFYYQIDENTYKGLEEGTFYIVKMSIVDSYNNEKELKLTYLKDDDELEELSSDKETTKVKRKKKSKLKNEKTNLNETNNSKSNINNKNKDE
ncbi:hypothetical protein HMPREF9225_1523 [Peptoniphilus duerdenii ATCC BAA-1640]|uniref:Uncharacterized protein n=1 Tax=Peptoniphilus duerdenii ATCC BAA-1640 TaxID=862517 RepID=E0NMY4_9FIRM|nr:hypothetical protein [Peptoniphilus duerdenii]EFM24952.1 hypothetical protein HMPREF9225_1523 [Peptoniphilus duerdenii ATCC BAA-1640]